MSSPGMTPQMSTSGQQGSQGRQGPEQAIQQFTALAEQVQQLAKQYPEFVESATKILPEIQKGMTKIAGNPARTPERQAPPTS